MNGINFKIVCRCCEKNVFEDPDDDDEGFESSIATLEHAMLSLQIAWYHHKLKSVVMFGTKDGNTRTFISNRLLHPLSKEEEEPDFDHISCFGHDQYILCAMNRD